MKIVSTFWSVLLVNFVLLFSVNGEETSKNLGDSESKAHGISKRQIIIEESNLSPQPKPDTLDLQNELKNLTKQIQMLQLQKTAEELMKNRLVEEINLLRSWCFPSSTTYSTIDTHSTNSPTTEDMTTSFPFQTSPGANLPQSTAGTTVPPRPIAHPAYVSLNDPGAIIVNQDYGCGGIIVGLIGEITFEYKSPSGTPKGSLVRLRCIWTVRARKKYTVGFRLLEDNLGKGSLLLNAYSGFFDGNQTKTLHASDRAEVTLQGWFVFVTLIADLKVNDRLSFRLLYEGTGLIELSPELKYYHYHFQNRFGSLDYPAMRGARNYSENEIVTFVINPVLPGPSSSFKVQTTFVDLVPSVGPVCLFDSLAHFAGLNRPGRSYYLVDGPISNKYRYCGRLGYLDHAFSRQQAESFISVFKSDNDDGYVYTGVKFNWTLTNSPQK